MTFGRRSLAERETLHSDLRTFVDRVDRFWSSTVLQGSRTSEEQAVNVAKGVSKTLESRHLPEFSADPEDGVDAVDLAPDPVRWPQLKPKLQSIDELLEALARDGLDKADRQELASKVKKAFEIYGKELGRWYAFAGFCHGIAEELYARGEISAPIGHGYDWDGDHVLTDQTLDDLPHHERRP